MADGPQDLSMLSQLSPEMQRAFAHEMFERLKEEYAGGDGLLQKEINRVLLLDPELFPPSWMSYDVQRALDAITEPHRRKKRLTVMRLAEAKAAGIPIYKVFDDPDTCARPTWYGNQNWGQRAWKEDPLIANALDVCEAAAHHYYDDIEMARMQLRQRQLGAAQDRLAQLARVAVETLGVIMLAGDSDDVRRKAAVDALTHAAPETAPKGSQEQTVRLRLDDSGPSMEDIRHRRRNRSSDDLFAEEEGESEIVDGIPGRPAGKRNVRSRRNGDEGDAGAVGD